MTLRCFKLLMPVVAWVLVSTAYAEASTLVEIATPGTYSLTADTQYDFISSKLAAGSVINDEFVFTSALTSGVNGVLMGGFIKPGADFVGLTLSWYQAGTPDVLLGQLLVSSPLGATLPGLTLAAGLDYVLRVSGHVASLTGGVASGGTYSFSLTTTPIPPAVLLFGSALMGLGWLGRRGSHAARTARPQ